MAVTAVEPLLFCDKEKRIKIGKGIKISKQQSASLVAMGTAGASAALGEMVVAGAISGVARKQQK